MSSTEHARLKKISRKAIHSKCKQKHAAACFKGGNLLSVGINKNRDPYRGFIPDQPCSEHAEVAALRQVQDTKGVVLYVARVMNEDKSRLGLSKPCEKCAKYIAARGVKKVIYSA